MTRIVEARIGGLRALGDVTVELGGLTVLIGDNGTGKSSILEALRMASLATTANFKQQLHNGHVLNGAVHPDGLKVELVVKSVEVQAVYALRVFPERASNEIIGQKALGEASHDSEVVAAIVDGHFQHGETTARLGLASAHSLLGYLGHGVKDEPIEMVRSCLAGIDCHLPFEVSASWAMRATGRRSAMRAPQLVEPSQRLALFGSNLANVYQNLKNSGFRRWSETFELLQLGIGPHLRDVSLIAAAGGHLSLALELDGVGHIPAYQLSDGQLTYLAFVALVQLDEGRTLLCFDEPEQHLHPELLGRVVQLLVAASERYPVVLATHSDRILDFLPDPVASVRVCELDENHQTVLRKLDAEQLEKWLKRYRGLGEIRAAGQLRSVLAERESA